MLGRFAIENRSLRRAPPWLALLAMLIQFVASYGHFDPGDFDALDHGHGALAVVSANWTGGNGANGMAADVDCPICASIAMMGSSALPEGVRIPIPAMQVSVAVATFAALHLTPPAHLLFDTRGPPLT